MRQLTASAAWAGGRRKLRHHGEGLAQRLAPTESSRAEGTLMLQEEGGAQNQSRAAAGGTPSPGLHRRVTV